MSIFIVTEPASELSMLTIDELRETAGVSDGSHDAALLRTGRGASAAIARACCIRDDGVNPPTLLQETCQERFDGVRGCDLRLARRPVTSITSIAIDGNAYDADDFELNRAAGNLSAPSGWRAGRIVVTYVAGFAALPDDLKQAAIRLVSAFRSVLGQEAGLKRVEVPDVITKEYWVAPKDNPLMSAEIVDLLAPYAERWL